MTIAHRLSTIKNANKIVVFDHGQIIEEGDHDKLMELNGTYKQLVLAQEISKVGLHEEDSVVDGKLKKLYHLKMVFFRLKRPIGQRSDV